MGCDIHPAIEVAESLKDPEWYRWKFVAMPDRSRNYEFFSLLAGVRGEHEAWIEPRGLPERVDWATRSSDDGLGVTGVVNGDHTGSWFTLEEARKFALPPEASEYTRMQWGRWLRTMEFYADLYRVSPAQVRAVFNFDS